MLHMTTIYIMNIMDIVRGSQDCIPNCILMEVENGADIVSVGHKYLLKWQYWGHLRGCNKQKTQNKISIYWHLLYWKHKATMTINICTIITNVLALIILFISMLKIWVLNLKSLFHEVLIGLEIQLLGSEFVTSMPVTTVSIVFGMVSLLDIIMCNIWLIVLNLVWLGMGYILTVVVNLKATAAMSKYMYGPENIMFHFAATCCFFIPNFVFLKDELHRKQSIMTRKQMGQWLDMSYFSACSSQNALPYLLLSGR